MGAAAGGAHGHAWMGGDLDGGSPLPLIPALFMFVQDTVAWASTDPALFSETPGAMAESLLPPK